MRRKSVGRYMATCMLIFSIPVLTHANTLLYVEPLDQRLPIAFTGDQEISSFLEEISHIATRQYPYTQPLPYEDHLVLSIDIRKKDPQTYRILFRNGNFAEWQTDIRLIEFPQDTLSLKSRVLSLCQSFTHMILSPEDQYGGHFIFNKNEYYDDDALARAMLEENGIIGNVEVLISEYLERPKLLLSDYFLRGGLILGFTGLVSLGWDGEYVNVQNLDTVGKVMIGSGAVLFLVGLAIQSNNASIDLLPAIHAYNDWYFETYIIPLLYN